MFTSAGVTTGIDLTLAIIQMDNGGPCALDVARELVVYMQRHGKQSQFAGIVDLQLQTSDSLSLRSGLSDQQQLNRAFKRQLGTSVNEYLA